MTRSILEQRPHTTIAQHCSVALRRGSGRVRLMRSLLHIIRAVSHPHHRPSFRAHSSRVSHLALRMSRDPAWEIPTRSGQTAGVALSPRTERFSTQNKVTLVCQRGRRDGFHGAQTGSCVCNRTPRALFYSTSQVRRGRHPDAHIAPCSFMVH